MPYHLLFHNYFNISNIDEVIVTGLRDKEFYDTKSQCTGIV